MQSAENWLRSNGYSTFADGTWHDLEGHEADALSVLEEYMLNAGDRITHNERDCIIHALELARKCIIDGEHKVDVVNKIDEARELFKFHGGEEKKGV